MTYERSYLARLHHVHTNPERHGLVENALDYPFCSYRWFVEQADPEFRRRVLGRSSDRVYVRDDLGVPCFDTPKTSGRR